MMRRYEVKMLEPMWRSLPRWALARRSLIWAGEAESAARATAFAGEKWRSAFGAAPSEVLSRCVAHPEPCPVCGGQGSVPVNPRATASSLADDRHRKRACPSCRSTGTEIFERTSIWSSGTTYGGIGNHTILPGEQGYMPPPPQPGSFRAEGRSHLCARLGSADPAERLEPPPDLTPDPESGDGAAVPGWVGWLAARPHPHFVCSGSGSKPAISKQASNKTRNHKRGNESRQETETKNERKKERKKERTTAVAAQQKATKGEERSDREGARARARKRSRSVARSSSNRGRGCRARGRP